MSDNREVQDLAFLHQWMRIARRPKNNLRQDIKLVFELIAVPLSDSELDIMQQDIDPYNNKKELTE